MKKIGLQATLKIPICRFGSICQTANREYLKIPTSPANTALTSSARTT